MNSFSNKTKHNSASRTPETACADNEIRLNLCVSQQGFTTKPTGEQVPKIVFNPRRVTIDTVLLYARQGRVFCYLFSTRNPDGLITLKDKKIENFKATSTIIYDFDDMEMSMMHYIGSLPYKPSFAYPTYSDGKNGLFRFRLAYVFDNEVTSVRAFNALYRAIAEANGFVKKTEEHGGLDKLSVAQMYYGSYSTSSTYNGNVVYSPDDFSPFVIAETEPRITVSDRTVPEYTKYETSISPEFFQDFFDLSEGALLAKYQKDFYQNYLLSLSSPLIKDESDWFFRYPENYVSVLHKRNGKYTLKWGIGEDRKMKVFITAQIMLKNLPSLSIENLLYNLVFERRWYYENSDNKISNEFLLYSALRAFNRSVPLNPTKHGMFTLNKAFWIEQGLSANQAKMIVRRYLKAREVEKYYNPSLTRKENLRVLRENGVRICERTLRRMVSRGDIKINKKNDPYTDLSYCPVCDTNQILDLICKNERITLSEMAKALNVSVLTVKRRLKILKGRVIEREGNNRTGRWKIRPPTNDSLSRSLPGVQMTDNDELK